MKYLLICLLVLPACSWKKSGFQFGELVVITDVEGYTRCTGNVRNYLGFDFYHLDNIWCDYIRPGVVGGESLANRIVAAKDMRLLWWQTTCSLGHCYTPVTGSGKVPDIQSCHVPIDSTSYKELCIYKQYFKTFGRWINTETGKTAEEEDEQERQQTKPAIFKI